MKNNQKKISIYPRFLRKTGRRPSRQKERAESTMNITGVQTIIGGYYDQLYANELGNLNKMDKFLETYTLLRLHQEEIKNLNGPLLELYLNL